MRVRLGTNLTMPLMMMKVSPSAVSVSYSMIVLYSRDHKGVGVAHKITSPKNQLQFS